MAYAKKTAVLSHIPCALKTQVWHCLGEGVRRASPTSPRCIHSLQAAMRASLVNARRPLANMKQSTTCAACTLRMLQGQMRTFPSHSHNRNGTNGWINEVSNSWIFQVSVRPKGLVRMSEDVRESRSCLGPIEERQRLHGRGGSCSNAVNLSSWRTAGCIRRRGGRGAIRPQQVR